MSDSQLLGDVLAQIPLTDGAYDTKCCQQLISDRPAHAVIPPRKNAKPWKDQTLRSMQRNELLKTVNLAKQEEPFGKSGLDITVEAW